MSDEGETRRPDEAAEPSDLDLETRERLAQSFDLEGEGIADDQDDQREEEEKEDPGRIFEEVPEPEEIKTPDDLPRYGKDDVTDEALVADLQRYWDTQELVYAGRITVTELFLPGRKVTMHTLDQGEIDWVGKQMDLEYGKLSPQVGVSSSYNEGVRLLTLSVAVQEIDGVSVYEPEGGLFDPLNPDLSFDQRKIAIERKSNAVRNEWQFWNAWVVRRMFDQVYRPLMVRAERGLSMLPFYSPTGTRLPESE